MPGVPGAVLGIMRTFVVVCVFERTSALSIDTFIHTVMYVCIRVLYLVFAYAKRAPLARYRQMQPRMKTINKDIPLRARITNDDDAFNVVATAAAVAVASYRETTSMSSTSFRDTVSFALALSHSVPRFLERLRSHVARIAQYKQMVSGINVYGLNVCVCADK